MEINFVNKSKKNDLDIKSIDGKTVISINVKNQSNYDIDQMIDGVERFLDKKINVNFTNIKGEDAENLLLKLNNISFSYTNPPKYNIPERYFPLLNEVEDYKKIVIEPNKYQDTMLKYFIKKIPKNYTYKKFSLKRNDKNFPLTAAVGAGSSHKSYFLHVFPKKHNKNWDDIFLIGKCVTFDSGGMNIKVRNMEEMKTDMAGSAIIMGVLNLTNKLPKNINLLIPIVENYIGSKATRPRPVLPSISVKTVEITDTDAEGRLCIADAVEYFNEHLYNKNLKNPLLIDIATLTGHTYYISCSTSSIVMGNKKAKRYMDKLYECGEQTKEFIDILQLRENYVKSLKSSVADIKNWSPQCKAGTLVGGAFIDFFVNKNIPWIHIDVAAVVYNNDKVKSYGINLLTKFLEKI